MAEPEDTGVDLSSLSKSMTGLEPQSSAGLGLDKVVAGFKEHGIEIGRPEQTVGMQRDYVRPQTHKPGM